MYLQDWYKQQARNKRGGIQSALAEKLGVQTRTAKSYLTGTRVLPSPLLVLTSEFTKGKTPVKHLAEEAREVSEKLKQKG